MSSQFPQSFGMLLRFWREIRGYSQEALALEAESSTRHISRLENAKALPSVNMIDKLAAVLDLGERDVGYLYLSAGQMPVAKQVDFNDPHYAWLRKAMLLTLKAMEPNPTVLTDRYGNILMVNRGWVAFTLDGVSKEQRNQISNYHDFLFTHQQLVDPKEVRMNSVSLILMAIAQEAIVTEDVEFTKLFDHLLQLKDIPFGWRQRAANLEPMTSYRVQFQQRGETVSYFNVNQAVGAMGPISFVSEPKLTISTLYPEDGRPVPELTDKTLSHPKLFF